MSEITLKCPECGKPMIYSEGKDEGSGDRLRWYADWICTGCGHRIHDWEDEFVFPDDILIIGQDGR